MLSDVTHADVKVVTELQIRGLSSRVFHCKFAEDISYQVLQTTHKQLRLVIWSASDDGFDDYGKDNNDHDDDDDNVGDVMIVITIG